MGLGKFLNVASDSRESGAVLNNIGLITHKRNTILVI
jgi:hypothetical protein